MWLNCVVVMGGFEHRTGHKEHDPPARDTLPPGHLRHSAMLAAPCSCPCRPAGHGEQSSGLLAPLAVEYDPTLQEIQVEALEAFSMLLQRPAWQGIQVLESSGPLPPCRPAPQALQDDWPVADTKPGAQDRHSGMMPPDMNLPACGASVNWGLGQ